MRNVKNAKLSYWQINKDQPKICSLKEAEVLSSQKAWQKYSWARKYFSQKPQSGYFIWIKRQPSSVLATCINISKSHIKQKMQNLLIIEKGLKVKMKGFCSSQRRNLSGFHQAQGKIIIKENSVLDYEHSHFWYKDDILKTDYHFFLDKKAKLNYFYQILSSPKESKINTSLILLENSSADINISGRFSKTKAEIKDNLILKGKNSSGLVKLRLIGQEKSQIDSFSQIKAEKESKGHLDCQGLLIDEKAEISLSPQLICQNKNAQLTHEASIGRISEEQLTYLRMRGLSEKQAINLIISGFLKN